MPVIATAAWSIPRIVAGHFASEGSGLARYASVFNGVEVNSTFYKPHRTSTYARWADSVPDDFRFALKLPKAITHEQRLIEIGLLFDGFLTEIEPLGNKIGPLLCQLPPSLGYDPAVVESALFALRQRFEGRIVIEARHKSWQSPDVLSLLECHAIDRVLADPAPVWPAETFPMPPVYVRLHGAPKIYYSSYDEPEIERVRRLLAADSWCVFDNTASGAAIENALTMLGRSV
ncbi:DUF72 domain-containing protein [Rhizobium sp. NFR03]|uniref:DUF72 domain-containing protein n=1 Tax=Rhizobium sp. NFR03 TaxID=1566263 RepID=UPI0008C75C5C|nr:DUF72 domain-containing protein [Rhizobium sp. NFR03]SES26459.1 Uncharacterized conserved protein YecE, DUF72 family [Rhizobium sp. NFR03]